MEFTRTVAYQLLRFLQRTPFRGERSYSTLQTDSSGKKTPFAQGCQELDRVDEFFSFFHDDSVRELLNGRTVLDFGCGYGGRTIGYAVQYGAARVVGVEVYANMVERCKEFAASMSVSNVEFLLSSQNRIPVDDETFDIVVSYDVMEHVEDPPKMLSEAYRTLKPGGLFLLVFTPYYGALSHHLGFVTKLPGIHWVFNARPLVDAANDLLVTDWGKQRLGTHPVGPAIRSFNGRRYCTPKINGMTTREFLPLLKDFEIKELHATPLLARYRVLGSVGAYINRIFSSSFGTVGEAVSFNVVCILKKA